MFSKVKVSFIIRKKLAKRWLGLLYHFALNSLLNSKRTDRFIGKKHVAQSVLIDVPLSKRSDEPREREIRMNANIKEKKKMMVERIFFHPFQATFCPFLFGFSVRSMHSPFSLFYPPQGFCKIPSRKQVFFLLKTTLSAIFDSDQMLGCKTHCTNHHDALASTVPFVNILKIELSYRNTQPHII